MATQTPLKPTPPKKVALYLINQTKLSMMEIWISYLRGYDNDDKEMQNFYISSAILAGPALTFIGEIKVPDRSSSVPMTSQDNQDSCKDSSKDCWMLYWRDENDSLNGLKAPLLADVDAGKGLVNLYVVGKDNGSVVRVNQLGETSGKPEPWDTLLRIPQEAGDELPAEVAKEENKAAAPA